MDTSLCAVVLYYVMNTVLFVLLFISVSVVTLILLAIAFVYGYAQVVMWKRPIMRFYEERSSQKDYCPYQQIPKKMTEYIAIVEDEYFFEHKGYRSESIRYAFKCNRKAKEIVSGGSTITQQLAKNMYFNFRRSYFRKIVELIIAIKLERTLSKKRILELYLNIIYFGNGKYGICDAAEFYFNCDVRSLSLNQMFILSCLVAVPTAGNPVQHPEVFGRIRSKWLDLKKDGRFVVPEEDAAVIRANTVEKLDPMLRDNDEFTRNYPQTIPMINERFGPAWKRLR